MRPWVIGGGDHLLQLAHQFGFDADTVWQDPSNEKLRALRDDPNILFAGDVLYIPEAEPAPTKTLVTGSTNSFVSPDPPTVDINVQFVGDDPAAFASKAYTIEELDQLTGLQTDGSGVATFSAPVTLETATLTFTETGDSYALNIGDMDPISTLPGIFKRLQNLGIIDRDAPFVEDDLSTLRVGLRFLKARQQPTGSDAAADSSPPDSSPPDSSPPDSASPPSSGASDDDGSDENACVMADNMWFGDDSGLADDGTLADDMAQLLLKAHGR